VVDGGEGGTRAQLFVGQESGDVEHRGS
jgi:hypothetical protein